MIFDLPSLALFVRFLSLCKGLGSQNYFAKFGLKTDDSVVGEENDDQRGTTKLSDYEIFMDTFVTGLCSWSLLSSLSFLRYHVCSILSLILCVIELGFLFFFFFSFFRGPVFF